MKVRQTIVNEYEAVQYTADMATGWAYLDASVRFLGSEPQYFSKKDGETNEEAFHRIKAENDYMRIQNLVKYYQHTNGKVILRPAHKAIYIFKDDKTLGIRKNKLKQEGYEIIEEDEE